MDLTGDRSVHLKSLRVNRIDVLSRLLPFEVGVNNSWRIEGPRSTVEVCSESGFLAYKTSRDQPGTTFLLSTLYSLGFGLDRSLHWRIMISRITMD